MRIVHFADTHLGHHALNYVDDRGRNLRQQDIYSAFRQAIDLIVEIAPDAVVHAGDLFDSWHPPTDAITAALDGVDRLARAGIPFVVVAGNHSTPRFRPVQHVFSLIERYAARDGGEQRVWAVAGVPQRIRIGQLAITAIPHAHGPRALDSALRAASPDPSAAFNVLTVHAGLDRLPRLGAPEAAAVEIDPGVLESARDFDYVALGHYHSWQPVRQNAYFSGSLEVLSFAERKAKVIAEVDLAAPDGIRITRHPVKRARVVRELDPVDAFGAADLGADIIAALDGIDLEGAVLRCPIVGITPDAYRALDRRAVDAATQECLHFELSPQFATSPRTKASAPGGLRAYITANAPAGLDADELVERAEALLADVQTGLAA